MENKEVLTNGGCLEQNAIRTRQQSRLYFISELSGWNFVSQFSGGAQFRILYAPEMNSAEDGDGERESVPEGHVLKEMEDVGWPELLISRMPKPKYEILSQHLFSNITVYAFRNYLNLSVRYNFNN